MALPTIGLSTDDIRGILLPGIGETIPTSFGDLCNCASVYAAGLDPTYCSGATPADRLNNLRSIPYVLNKFRGYEHSIFVDIQRIFVGDPNYPGYLPGATWSWDDVGNTYDPVGFNSFEVSMGFDSSAGGLYYDASIADVSSWIVIKNAANDPLEIGSTVKPVIYGLSGTMRLWPNSQNTSYDARGGQLVMVNNYGGQETWPIIQSGMPIPPPSINDWLIADISALYPSAPFATLQTDVPFDYIHMFAGWKFVLTLTNVSTNTVNFSLDSSVAVVSKSQYEIMEKGYDFPGPWLVHYFYSGSTPALPSSLNAGQTWSSGVIDIRFGGMWDSSTNYQTSSLWAVNEWWPNVYFSGTVGTLVYNNEVVKWGNTDPVVIHQPDVSVRPSAIHFTKNGSANVPVEIEFYDTYWWNGLWEATKDLSWITLTNASDYGDGYVYVTCAQQPNGGAYRSGTITISSIGPARTISVSQDASIAAPVAGIQIRESGYGSYGTYMSGDWDYNSTNPCGFYQIDVSSSGSWYVTGDGGDWSLVPHDGSAGVTTVDITFTGSGSSSTSVYFKISGTTYSTLDLIAQDGCG